MNTKILKVEFPSETHTIPVDAKDIGYTWTYDGGIYTYHTQVLFTDYPNMYVDLSDIASGSGLVLNYSFETPDSAKPSGSSVVPPNNWSGTWISESNYNNTSQVVGFHRYGKFPPEGSRWKVAASRTGLTTAPPTALGRVAVYSDKFTVSENTEYSTSFRHWATNGSCIKVVGAILPEKSNSYDITLGTKTITIENNPDDYFYYRDAVYGNKFVIEPEYGVIIAWYNSAGNLLSLDLVGNEKGVTTNDYIDDYVDTITPIWKTNRNSVLSPSGAISARIYLYNRHEQIPTNTAFAKCTRPTVLFDYITLRPSLPYIYQDFPIMDNFDSYGYMDIAYPKVEIKIDSLTPIIAASAVTGHPLELLSSSEKLYVGKVSSGSAAPHQTWLGFNGNSFNTLTEGVYIHSASLVVTPTEDVPSSPARMCYMSAGMQKSLAQAAVKPTTWASLGGPGSTVVGAQTIPIEEPWITGEEKQIDVTDTVRALFGHRAITWNVKDFAIVLRDNGSSDNAFRSFAYDTIYPKPSLLINYLPNGYRHKALFTYIDQAQGSINKFDTTITSIGGGTSASAVKRGLVRFDLSALPSGNITSGSFYFYQRRHDYTTGAAQTIQICKENTKWDYYGASWLKSFGTSAGNNWAGAGAGGGSYGASLITMTAGSATTSPDYLWVTASFSGSTSPMGTALNNMKSNPATNYGFILVGENNASKISGLYSSNHPNTNVRPYLKVVINNKTYIINSAHVSESPTVPPPITEPNPPPPEPPGAPTRVTLVHQQSLQKGLTYTYSIRGEANTKRYILITDGWWGHNEGWDDLRGKHFHSLKFGNLDMTKLITTDNGSDEANIQVWGVKIPENYAKGVAHVISGVGNNTKTKNIYIREFSGVNSTTPIKAKKVTRNGANSALSATETIAYAAKGFVVADIYLDNPNVGLATKGANQTKDLTRVDTGHGSEGYSHYTNIPGNTSGMVSVSWSWEKDPDGDYTNWGSDNAIAVVSFNPNTA